MNTDSINYVSSVISASIDVKYIKKIQESMSREKRLSTIITYFQECVSDVGFARYTGLLWVYTGMIYERITKEEFSYVVDRALSFAQVDNVPKFRTMIIRACYMRTYGNIIESIRNDIVCFRNGVLEIDKELGPILHKHNKRYFCISVLDFEYDERKTCPLWRKFLDEVLPEETLQMVLQEYLGRIFLNNSECKIEKMLWLFGSGANGKSVIFETIVGMLGINRVTSFAIQDLVDTQQGAKNLAAINGMLLNFSSDMDSKAISSDTVKGIISGEPVMARKIYGEPFKACDLPPLMANTNVMPMSKDKSNAWLRRIMIIPFNITIPPEKQDVTLAIKLKDEYAGIFNWILEGRERLIDQNYHFTESDTINEYIEMYRKDNNSVVQWVEFYGIQPKPDMECSIARVARTYNLYESYCRWCIQCNVPTPERMSQRLFAKEMNRMQFRKGKKGAMNVYTYYGHSIVDNA